MALIERRFLRTEVRTWMMKQMFAGELRPGSQIVEHELAAHLGVSRTPLREALLQLECEGFLRAQPGKGYVVRDLVRSEAIGLFELGILLEPLALTKAGIPEVSHLDELDALNEERVPLIDRPDGARSIDLDDRWHRTLVRECPNVELLNIIGTVRQRLYRYLCISGLGRSDLASAIEEHREIVRRLREGELDEAAEALVRHWDVGRQIVLKAEDTFD